MSINICRKLYNRHSLPTYRHFVAPICRWICTPKRWPNTFLTFSESYDRLRPTNSNHENCSPTMICQIGDDRICQHYRYSEQTKKWYLHKTIFSIVNMKHLPTHRMNVDVTRRWNNFLCHISRIKKIILLKFISIFYFSKCK